jgi:hypothetical protein
MTHFFSENVNKRTKKIQIHFRDSSAKFFGIFEFHFAYLSGAGTPA